MPFTVSSNPASASGNTLNPISPDGEASRSAAATARAETLSFCWARTTSPIALRACVPILDQPHSEFQPVLRPACPMDSGRRPRCKALPPGTFNPGQL